MRPLVIEQVARSTARQQRRTHHRLDRTGPRQFGSNNDGKGRVSGFRDVYDRW